MQSSVVRVLILAVLFAAGTASALETSLTGYGTYWDGEDEGYGVGLRLKKSLLDILSIDGRGGYVEFNDSDTSIIPLEASLNLGLPFLISPYVGVGAGYYFADSSVVNDSAGYFGQIGIEFKILVVGVMAELRYMDCEESYLDGVSANAGLLLKW